jgi:hypothetical protein
MMTRLAFVLAFLASACCVAATPPCVQWTSPLQFTIANDPRVANGNTNGVYGRASWSFDKNDTALSNNSIRFVLCYAPRNLTTDPIVLPMTQLATQSQLLYSLNQTVLYSSDQHTQQDCVHTGGGTSPRCLRTTTRASRRSSGSETTSRDSCLRACTPTRQRTSTYPLSTRH